VQKVRPTDIFQRGSLDREEFKDISEAYQKLGTASPKGERQGNHGPKGLAVAAPALAHSERRNQAFSQTSRPSNRAAFGEVEAP
jgi:hypothetical protein|tara:strand:- start:1572 stop:1823 length:252 start_codon:yes stop_codon:yes gene_type:complete